MHALTMHVPEFIRMYGSISKFNQQGLEKVNDITTTRYLRGANHRKTKALSYSTVAEKEQNCGLRNWGLSLAETNQHMQQLLSN